MDRPSDGTTGFRKRQSASNRASSESLSNDRVDRRATGGNFRCGDDCQHALPHALLARQPPGFRSLRVGNGSPTKPLRSTNIHRPFHRATSAHHVQASSRPTRFKSATASRPQSLNISNSRRLRSTMRPKLPLNTNHRPSPKPPSLPPLSPTPSQTPRSPRHKYKPLHLQTPTPTSRLARPTPRSHTHSSPPRSSRRAGADASPPEETHWARTTWVRSCRGRRGFLQCLCFFG